MILSPETLGFQKTDLENSYRLELPGHYVLQTYQYSSRVIWFLFDQRDEKLEDGVVHNVNHGFYAEAIAAARKALGITTERHQKALSGLDKALIETVSEI